MRKTFGKAYRKINTVRSQTVVKDVGSLQHYEEINPPTRKSIKNNWEKNPNQEQQKWHGGHMSPAIWVVKDGKSATPSTCSRTPQRLTFPLQNTSPVNSDFLGFQKALLQFGSGVVGLQGVSVTATEHERKCRHT